MSIVALQFDPGFNHFNMGSRSSFAWPGMQHPPVQINLAQTWFANNSRCRPRVFAQRPIWRGPRPLRFRGQPEPSLSLALQQQQPDEDATRAARAEEATRPGPPRLQARSTSSPRQQPIFTWWPLRGRITTALDQRGLHHKQRRLRDNFGALQHANLYHCAGQYLFAD